MPKQHWTLTVVVPAYNEEATIGGIVAGVRQLDIADEILVVDDGSDDRTAVEAAVAGATVLQHPYNIGNGAAVKTGLRHATGDVILFLDGDGQHDPRDIPELLAHMDAYDMAVGARTKDAKVSPFRSLGNWGLIKLAEYLSGHKIPDLTSGFRAFRRGKILRFVHLLPNRYSYPTTSILAFLQAGHTIRYVPLDSIRKRKTGNSSINPFRDGFRFVNIMLRTIMLFAPQKIFVPASLALLVPGLSLLGYNIFVQHNINDAAVIVTTVGTLTFFFGLLADQIAHIRREIGRPGFLQFDEGFAPMRSPARLDVPFADAEESEDPPVAPRPPGPVGHPGRRTPGPGRQQPVSAGVSD